MSSVNKMKNGLKEQKQDETSIVKLTTSEIWPFTPELCSLVTAIKERDKNDSCLYLTTGSVTELLLIFPNVCFIF